MAYLPGFANDIFISYAHRDNEPFGAQRGWVDSFSEALGVRLAQLLGDPPSIWRESRLQGNDVFADETVDAIARSAIFVCLVSPSYVKSEWCLRELQTFLSSRPGDPSEANVIKLVVSPVPYSHQPQELERLAGFQFFSLDPATGLVHQLRQGLGKETELAFWDGLDRVAQAIARRLSELSESRRSRLGSLQLSEIPAKVSTLSVVEENASRRKLRVFLCHSSGDKPQVRLIYEFLTTLGADPWLDEEKLLPGQNWELEIKKAVRTSDAIIVCLSSNSTTKVGFIQKELRQALDVADEQPDDAVFLIPARLEDCKIPEKLSGRQWVNLFEERGNELLARALHARATQLSVEKFMSARPAQ
jgi:hypothetical protein